MNADENLVREIVQRVRRVCTPEKIILFGSAAAGTMTRDSDIDVLVLETRPLNAYQEWVKSAMRSTTLVARSM